MMAEDEEVVHEVWAGKLPIEFRLSDDEIESVEKPKPYYILVPRISYFPLVVEKVSRYFSLFIKPADQDELWLEYEGMPLKWHYPIGVLYDLCSINLSLPWQITVHYKRFPHEEIMHFKQREVLEDYFMQCLKEADQLKHQGKILREMQKKDHKQLWNGFSNDKFEQFWLITRRLMENTDNEPIRYIPLRFYLADQPCIQRLCKPLKDNGDRTMLSDIFELIQSELTRPTDGYRLVSHGVELTPTSTPVLWLCTNFSYADNFVHICILN